MVGSAGVQPHEQPMVVGSGLCVVIALMIAVSRRSDVHYQARQSRSHPDSLRHVERLLGVVTVAAGPLYTQDVLVPSVESRVIGTLLVWSTFVK